MTPQLSTIFLIVVCLMTIAINWILYWQTKINIKKEREERIARFTWEQSFIKPEEAKPMMVRARQIFSNKQLEHVDYRELLMHEIAKELTRADNTYKLIHWEKWEEPIEPEQYVPMTTIEAMMFILPAKQMYPWQDSQQQENPSEKQK